MMSKIALFVCCALLVAQCGGQRHRPLTQPVPATAPLYKARDFVGNGVFTKGIEGPAVGPNGMLYAVNIGREGTIGAVGPSGEASLFLTLPPGSVGNGLGFDRLGRLYVADYIAHNILRYVPPAWKLEVFAHEPRMNQPNDLVIDRDGVVYASDPNWGDATGQIWRIDPSGNVTLFVANLGTTNGIELSPDESILYVNESVQRRVWAFALSEKGVIGKRLLYEFREHGLDGMRCDSQGNIFIARHRRGTIAMLSPTGALVREVKLKGKRPTNLAFGGVDGRTIYVTVADRGAIEMFRSEFPGRSWRR